MNRMQMFTALAAVFLIGGCATTDNSTPAAAAPMAGGNSKQASSSPAPAPAPRSASELSMGPGGANCAGTRGSGPTGRSVCDEYEKADRSAEDGLLVEANARYLRAHPESKVRVEGNADERG